MMRELHEDEADGRIRDAFRSTARPVPSPHFDRRLRAAVFEEKCRLGTAKIRVRVMRAYWVVTGATAIGILSALPWSNAPDGAWVPLLLVTALIALPAALLRFDLIDVILDSTERLRDPS